MNGSGSSLHSVFHLIVLSLLFSGSPLLSFSQHLDGDRILRASFLEMRSFNRELGHFVGFGGFGGVLEDQGPVLESSSITVGLYPQKEGTITVTSLNSSRKQLVKKRFQGWGVDLKYQFLAFLNGKADESGAYLRWGSSLHYADFQLEYDPPPDFNAHEELYPEGRREKMGFYFEAGIGHRFDLGIPNLLIELQGGIPVTTTGYRLLELIDGSDNFGEFTDIDDGSQFFGMPYFWGARLAVML